MNDEAYIVKQVKKLYDIKINTSVTYPSPVIKFRIVILFTPKEFTTISPNKTKSVGVWYYNPHTKKSDFYGFIYIRGNDMPILKYTQEDYELDTFLEEISFKEYKRALGEIIGNPSL